MSATIFPGYQAAPTLIKTGLTVAANGTFFTVAGGRVRILELFFNITTVIGAPALTMKLSANVAGTDSDLCAASASLAAKPVGTLLTVTGLPTDALVISTGEGATRGSSLALLVQPCTIDTVLTNPTTGAMTGYLTYVPLDAGASVT